MWGQRKITTFADKERKMEETYQRTETVENTGRDLVDGNYEKLSKWIGRKRKLEGKIFTTKIIIDIRQNRYLYIILLMGFVREVDQIFE